MRIAAAIFSFGLLTSIASPSQADLVGWLAGDTIDKTSSDIDGKLAYIDRIIEQHRSGLDRQIHGYFGRIDNIISDVDYRANRFTENLYQKVLSLEEEIISDIYDILWEAECLIERATTNQLPDILKDNWKNLSEIEPEVLVSIFGFDLVTLSTKSADEIETLQYDHVNIYRKYKEGYIALLENYFEREGDGGAAWAIPSVFLSIANVARYTSCHYTGGSTDAFAIELMNDYHRFGYLASQWITTIKTTQSDFSL